MPSRLRVPLGYAVGLLVLLLSRPSLESLLLGLPLGVTGEGIRVWASGHIDKTRSLATGGPYAFTRNPLYVGSLLLALALAVSMSAVTIGAILSTALLIGPAAIALRVATRTGVAIAVAAKRRRHQAGLDPVQLQAGIAQPRDDDDCGGTEAQPGTGRQRHDAVVRMVRRQCDSRYPMLQFLHLPGKFLGGI